MSDQENEGRKPLPSGMGRLKHSPNVSISGYYCPVCYEPLQAYKRDDDPQWLRVEPCEACRKHKIGQDYTFSCLACGNPLRARMDTTVLNANDIRIEPCEACLEHERSRWAKKAEGGAE